MEQELRTIRGMPLSDFLFQAVAFRSFYYRIRAARSSSARRRWYRLAAKEKGRLAALGVHPEAIRLYGLYLINPKRDDRYDRFLEAFKELPAVPQQLSLF